MNINDISGAIVDAAVKIHIALGPGLLETVYEAILERELLRRGLRVRRQWSRPLISMVFVLQVKERNSSIVICHRLHLMAFPRHTAEFAHITCELMRYVRPCLERRFN